METELVLGGKGQTDATTCVCVCVWEGWGGGGGGVSHGPHRRPGETISALCFGFCGTSPLGLLLVGGPSPLSAIAHSAGKSGCYLGPLPGQLYPYNDFT